MSVRAQSQNRGYWSVLHTHTHTHTHNSLLFPNWDTIFAYCLWNLTSKSLLIQDSVCVSLLTAASPSVVRRSSICLLISFPYITCDRLSCVPLPYFTPYSARTVQYSWLDGYYLKTYFIRASTTDVERTAWVLDVIPLSNIIIMWNTRSAPSLIIQYFIRLPRFRRSSQLGWSASLPCWAH